MKINNALWDNLKKEIELTLEQDKMITHVLVDYQFREIKELKNILKIKVKL